MHRPFRFVPPPLGANVVARPRLVAVLARRFESRLVVVEAGAGFGKTTVLTQALHENRLAPAGADAWLSCDPADVSPSRLLADAVTALGGSAPDSRPATVEDVAEAALARAPERVCLLFDDVHQIHPDSEGAAALAELVDALPANTSVVLAGRRIPQVGAARLRAAGRAQHVSETDLALDEDDLAALAVRHGVAPEVLAGLGGWPALAELTAAAGRTFAQRFVDEEILAGLSSSQRWVFECAVALGGSDRHVLAEVAGVEPEFPALARLPLTSVDADSVRPHHLWAELLGARLAADDLAAARRRGAAILARSERFADAFETLAAAHDWDAALGVLVEGCNDQRRPPWLDVLVEWRRSIPAEFRDRAAVRYLDAMIERSVDPWSATCRTRFDDAIGAFTAAGEPGRAMAGAVRASYVDWIRGDVERLRGNIGESEVGVTAGLIPVAVLRLAEANLADATGDSATVRAALSDLGDVEARLAHFRGLYLALAALWDGDGDGAVAPAESAVAPAKAVFPAAGSGLAMLLPALARWSSGDVTAADHPSLADPGLRVPVPERVQTLGVAGLIAAHLGLLERAEGFARSLATIRRDPEPRDAVAVPCALLEATIAAARGDEQAALDTLRAALAGRSFASTHAGRWLAWFPALPALADPQAREWLGRGSPGPSRRRALGAIDALAALRAGRQPGHVELLDDLDAVLTVFTPPQAVELTAGLVMAGHPNAQRQLDALAARSPLASRTVLARLTERSEGRERKALLAVRKEMPIPPPHRVAVELLGPAKLVVGDGEVTDRDWRRERVRQLLATLVMHRHIRRSRVGALLWPDHDPDSVSANLRMTLSYLHGVLEPTRDKADAPWFIRQDAGTLSLRDDATLDVDVWAVERALDAADQAAQAGTPSVQLAALRTALVRWHGEPYQDLADFDWAAPGRQDLVDRLVRAGARAGELSLAAGDPAGASAAAEQVLRADRWSEAAHRVAISAALATGERDAARQAASRARWALEDLGVTPEASTQALLDRAS